MKRLWTDKGLITNGIADLIASENSRQLEKWGIQSRNPFEWLAYITEEVGELSEAISEYTYRNGSIKDIKKEAIQVATLALKVAEMALAREKQNREVVRQAERRGDESKI